MNLLKQKILVHQIAKLQNIYKGEIHRKLETHIKRSLMNQQV